MVLGLTRRLFMAAGASALFVPNIVRAQQTTLRAEPVTAQILPDGDGMTEMLGLNGKTPGPELRIRQGETLNVQFQNNSGAPSALHWHGIRIDNAMDGVPDLTQDVVPDGGTFDYSFVAPDAGTFWYHSHNRSWEQVAKGLYGPLIVEEPNPPRVDHDITVTVDDWRLDEDGTMMDGFGNMHDFAHAGRLGNFARAIPSVSEVRRGDRVRIRLINAATARVFPLKVSGIDGRIVALDGFPLSKTTELGQLEMAPAQRIDIIADVTADVVFDFPTNEGPYEMGRIAMTGENDTPIDDDIEPLPVHGLPTPKADPDQSLRLTMQGGAMSAGHAGDDVWAFNGTSGMPDKPWATFKTGETARLTLANDTSWPHGIHLHGHHFHEVKLDSSLGPLRDTTLIQRGESRDIVCVFDNPGKWLIHCHMLGHQASGMKTWVEVI